MPRDSGGTYNLSASGNPVISGTVIQSSWANPTMNDLANALTDSLSRTGSGGMLVPFTVPDGTAASPSYSFINNVLSGLYLFASNDVRLSASGVDLARFSAGKVQQWDATGMQWLDLYQPLANTSLQPGDNVSDLSNDANYVSVGDDVSDLTNDANYVDQTALNLKANIASPALTGNPTAPTQSTGNNSTRLASTAFVQNQIGASVGATVTSSGSNANGFFRIWSDGFIQQWKLITPTGASVLVTFPVSFSSAAALAPLLTMYHSSAAVSADLVVDSATTITTTTFRYITSAGHDGAIWRCEGY